MDFPSSGQQPLMPAYLHNMNSTEQKSLQDEIRLALDQEKTINKRETKKNEATQRASSFLKNEENSEKIIRKSLGLFENNNQPPIGQPLIQYQNTTTASRPSSNAGGSQTEIQTILPPRPIKTTLHVLCVQNGVLRWVETESCD
jgi:hypothetical protein